MNVTSNIEVERLKDGNYKVVNVIEQIMNKKEMLNLLKTRVNMKENSNKKIAGLEDRKNNIVAEVKKFETETKAKLEEEIKNMSESIKFDTIDQEILALKKAVAGDKEIDKMEKSITKLITEYAKKQDKLKMESEKINKVLQGELNKF